MSSLFDRFEDRLQNTAWPMLELLERFTNLAPVVIKGDNELKELHDEACHLIATIRGNNKEVAA
jgi:hypothetical protein